MGALLPAMINLLYWKEIQRHLHHRRNQFMIKWRPY